MKYCKAYNNVNYCVSFEQTNKFYLPVLETFQIHQNSSFLTYFKYVLLQFIPRPIDILISSLALFSVLLVVKSVIHCYVVFEDYFRKNSVNEEQGEESFEDLTEDDFGIWGDEISLDRLFDENIEMNTPSEVTDESIEDTFTVSRIDSNEQLIERSEPAIDSTSWENRTHERGERMPFFGPGSEIWSSIESDTEITLRYCMQPDRTEGSKCPICLNYTAFKCPSPKLGHFKLFSEYILWPWKNSWTPCISRI